MRKSIASFVVIASMTLAAPAFAQATRTWVSGVGDDVNPCSRTAPCKTFAGAISKTANNGEINAIDSGGFGAVTITKSITIDGSAVHASILASGTSGIIVSGAGIIVNLRNLSINGASTTAGSGIRVINAGALNVDNVVVMNFTGTGSVGKGIAIETSTADVRVTIANSLIYNNGNFGITAAPTAGNVVLNVENTRIFKGANSGINLQNNVKANISNCNISNHSVGAGVVLQQSTAEAHISNSVLSNNANGVFSGVGGGTPTTRLYGNVITGNTSSGLTINSGSIFSHGNNAIRGNAGNEAPTGASIGQQ